MHNIVEYEKKRWRRILRNFFIKIKNALLPINSPKKRCKRCGYRNFETGYYCRRCGSEIDE